MDPYALCPCGSGKKVKFCCQPMLAEMEKVERLQDNNQPRMALQLLEKLDKSHPGNPWVLSRRGLALIDDDRPEEAEVVLKNLLRAHGDHPLGNVLYGIAAFNAHGMPEGKKAVHRAFRRGVAQFPELVATLAANVAALALAEAWYMSARQHMALALRLGGAEQRKRAFSALLELDGDASVAYPYRGAHQTPDPASLDAEGEVVRKASRLAGIGCWEEAADVLAESVADESGNAALWHTIGLYRAWDGDDALAAIALHRAASRYEDFETAVECETLAQLLEQYDPARTRKMRVAQFQTESVSRLLSRLDAADRLMRMETEETIEGAADLAARYLVLDRAWEKGSEANPDTLPRFLARVVIFDAQPDRALSSRAIVSGLEGQPLDEAARVFAAAAGDLVTRYDDSEFELPEENVTGVVPAEQADLFQNFYFPAGVRGAERRRIQSQEWARTLGERWPTTPLMALGGLSPRDAAERADLRVALAAAIFVFDVFCSTRHFMLPVDELRKQFGLPPVVRLTVSANTNLHMLSLMQLQRVELESLTHEQLHAVLERWMLVRHPTQMKRALEHTVRVGAFDGLDGGEQAVLASLSDLSRDSLQIEESLQWIERGRQAADAGEQRFERILQWRMRELMVRLEDPEDPELPPLLRELWQNYGGKLPWLRGQLQQLVETIGISSPWEGAVVVPGEAGGRGGEAVWSPSGAAAAAASGDAGKRLWLPGER